MADTGLPNQDCGPSPRRRLAAILHGDIVGYSRSMGEDEAGTHARLMAQRTVVGDCVQRHEGRIVGTAGDAILAEFASVVEALRAAVEMQAELGARDAGEPAWHRLPLRIGINVGDVIVDGDDIFGDGINVAARIQALAEPGGIAVSGAVRDQARNKLELEFDDLGQHRVKNIEEPIRVYAAKAAQGRPTTRRGSSRRGAAGLAMAVAAAVLAGFAVWLWQPQRLLWSLFEPPTAPTQKSGRPTIAVLPFEDRGGDPGQGYFSDGVTEDVIADLGRFSNLLVLSWSAVAPYQRRAVTPRQLSQELDVRYLVGGTVRRVADRLRVTVQLTDAAHGLLLWSERYDEPAEDIFTVQDQISRQVVSALAVELTQLEAERAFQKPTEKLGAYDLVLRGRELLRRFERKASIEARSLFEQALAIDPRYGDAMVGLAWTYMNDFYWGWSEWPDRALAIADDLTRRAVSLDERNAPAHAMHADVLRFREDHGAAEREIDRALELNPNNATSHAIRGSIMAYSGRPEEAVASLELALRLDPHPLNFWLVNLAMSYYFLGRYADVIGLFERFGPPINEDPMPQAVKAAAYAQLGNAEKAGQALAELGRISPFFDAEGVAASLGNPENGQHLLEGLRKAGLE